MVFLSIIIIGQTLMKYIMNFNVYSQWQTIWVLIWATLCLNVMNLTETITGVGVVGVGGWFQGLAKYGHSPKFGQNCVRPLWNHPTIPPPPPKYSIAKNYQITNGWWLYACQLTRSVTVFWQCHKYWDSSHTCFFYRKCNTFYRLYWNYLTFQIIENFNLNFLTVQVFHNLY